MKAIRDSIIKTILAIAGIVVLFCGIAMRDVSPVKALIDIFAAMALFAPFLVMVNENDGYPEI